MINVGDILCTVRGVQYCGGYHEYSGGVQYHGGYHEYCGGCEEQSNISVRYERITCLYTAL